MREFLTRRLPRRPRTLEALESLESVPVTRRTIKLLKDTAENKLGNRSHIEVSMDKNTYHIHKNADMTVIVNGQTIPESLQIVYRITQSRRLRRLKLEKLEFHLPSLARVEEMIADQKLRERIKDELLVEIGIREAEREQFSASTKFPEISEGEVQKIITDINAGNIKGHQEN